MYAKYVATASPTFLQIQSDIGKILTGETNVNNLSASCNTLATTISGTPGAWTMVDDNIGTYGGFVISGAAADGSTKMYKFGAISSANIYFNTLTAWNSTSNTATNLSNAVNQNVPTISSAVIYIGSNGTEWFYVCHASATMYMYGLEVLREGEQMQYNTTLGAWPDCAIAEGGPSPGTFRLSSVRTPTTISTLAAPGNMVRVTVGTSVTGGLAYDNYGTPYVPTSPVMAAITEGGTLSLPIFCGRIRGGVRLGPLATVGDTILINGIQYFISPSRYCFPLG